MTTELRNITSRFIGRLEPAKTAGLLVGFFYVCGYLIQAITLRNFGIHRLETVRFHYIEVGVTFSVLMLLITLVPLGCYLAHFRIRERSGLPNYRLGAIGYLLNTYNLFLVTMFSALFITNAEWGAVVAVLKGRPFTYGHVLPLYAVFAASVLVFFPLLERIVVSHASHPSMLYAFLIEPLRYGAVLTGLAFDLLLLHAFPWTGILFTRGLTFLASALLLAAVVAIVLFYIRKVGDERSLHVLAALGTVGSLVILYMCINAYVFGVVRHIPMNRGGKLPITCANLISGSAVLRSIPAETEQHSVCTVIGPVYIVDEADDFIHVTKPAKLEWFTEWVPTYSVKKTEIQFVEHRRVSLDGPRGHSIPLLIFGQSELGEGESPE